MARSLENNVKVKLGLLEAKAGRDASISWCKALVESRKTSKNVKMLLETNTQNPEAAIQELRRQKVESKFYHVREKLLPKQMKKVKTFLIQRMIKKIKQTRTDESEKFKGDLQIFESELLKLKALDHIKLAFWTFNCQVLKEKYLQEKIKDLGIVNENSGENQVDLDGIEKICSVKCFQDAIKVCKADLCLFLKKLLHEAYEVPVVPVEANKNRQVKSDAPLSSNRSFFMESLNAEDSEVEESSGLVDRISFTDDEDEEGLSELESKDEIEQTQNKKKKNRLGQLARRRLAERAYGQEAKHIKSGGLTVQQKEAQRLQKSQQRKERLARIKTEEATKPSESRSRTKIHKNSNLKVKNLFNTEINNSNSKNGIDLGSTQSVPKTVLTKKIDPNMHPSWIAKVQQQNKAKIAATVKGQKITFD